MAIGFAPAVVLLRKMPVEIFGPGILTFTVKVPSKPLATRVLEVGTVAMPSGPVTTTASVPVWENKAPAWRATLTGVKFTWTPSTGLPLASVTLTDKGVGKAVFIIVYFGWAVRSEITAGSPAGTNSPV